MDLKQCNRTELYLSTIGTGIFTQGHDTDGPETLDMLRHFVDAGGNLVECSVSHGDGMTVDILSEAILAIGRYRMAVAWRGDVRRASEDAWVSAAGRGNLLRSLDDVLARLDTDCVNVWMAKPRPKVPPEETSKTTTTAYRPNCTCCVGLSRATQRQLAEAVTHGVFGASAPILVVELPFSLADTSWVARVAELSEHGVGVIAMSTLAGGALAGRYRHSTPAGSHAAPPYLCHLVEGHLTDSAHGVIEVTARMGAGLECSTGGVALAWMCDYPGVTSALVGPHALRRLETLLDYTEPLPAPIRQVLFKVTQQ